jgi:hypothetical protein
MEPKAIDYYMKYFRRNSHNLLSKPLEVTNITAWIVVPVAL